MALSVGNEILNYCGQCKLMLGATIVAMLGTDVIKVQCRTCKSVQKFKATTPGGKRKITTSTRSTATTVSAHELWQNRMDEVKADAIKYNIKQKFKLGDMLEHPKFGIGFIEKTIDNDKIDVLFKGEVKTLIHNKG